MENVAFIPVNLLFLFQEDKQANLVLEVIKNDTLRKIEREKYVS